MRSTRIPAVVADPPAGSGTPGSGPQPPTRVLLVDREDGDLAAWVEDLRGRGLVVERADDADAALASLDRGGHAVIVAEATPARIDVLSLLRLVRLRDLDIPLVVVTDTDQVGLSRVTVEQGALCYLEKPVSPERLSEMVAYAGKLYLLAKQRRRALDVLGGPWSQMGDRAALEQAFERAFDCLSVAFQPIISWSGRRVIGHEALLRSSDPRLPDPTSVLALAERLGRIEQIGRLVRERVARSMSKSPAEFVFINIHAHELLDSELFSSAAPLSQFGKRVVLELAEHTLLDEVEHLEVRAQALRKLGFRLAMDNLGPGHPGLSSLARLRPEYVKYDQSLVRGVDRNPAQAEVVAGMTALFAAMNIRVVAAGIESLPERDAMIAAGVDLLQGFAFSKPDTAYRQPDLG